MNIKKLLAVAILILFIGMSVTPSSCLPIKQDFTSLAKKSAPQIMPYRYSINYKETFFEPEHEKILLQDDDVELLWNISTEVGRHIGSAFINDDDVPDILACNYTLDGSTGEIIYQFEKGKFLSLGDVNNDGQEEIITSEDDWKGLSTLCCINASVGSVIWEREIPISVIPSISIGDVTGDSTNEVVVGAFDVYCLNGNSGSIIWQKQAPGAYDHFGCTAISDVNNDGYNEVIAGTSNNDARVFCLEGDKGDVIINKVEE